MKRYFQTAGFMAVAIAATFLTACSSDGDGDIMDGNTPPESEEVTSFDQVDYLQNNIVEIDLKGQMVRRVNGAVLYTADTTEVYIGTMNIDDAYNMYRSMYQGGNPPPMPAPSAGHESAPLKDAKGVVKETVYFNAVEDGPTIAEVSFASNKVMKHFSKIKFIKASAWPYNDASPYAEGDIVTYETANEGMQKWVCIREAKCGVSGLLMNISQQERDYSSVNQNCASVSLAETASKILRENWQMYVTYFSKAGRTLDDSYYWIKSGSGLSSAIKSPAIRLQDGDIRSFSGSSPDKHYIQIRTFGIESVE